MAYKTSISDTVQSLSEIQVPTDGNLDVNLGDTAGARKLVIKDSSDTEVANIDSNGLFTSITGLTLSGAVSGITTLGMGGDLTNYENTNDASPSIFLGSAAAECVEIQSVYDAGAKTLNYIQLQTYAASAAADKGEWRIGVDGTDILHIDDGGLEVTGTVDATGGFTDGVMTINGSGGMTGVASLAMTGAITGVTDLTVNTIILGWEGIRNQTPGVPVRIGSSAGGEIEFEIPETTVYSVLFGDLFDFGITGVSSTAASANITKNGLVAATGAAIGGLLYIWSSSTTADIGWYRVTGVPDANTITVDRVLSGTQTDLKITPYTHGTLFKPSDGTNGQTITHYSKYNKPLQIGGTIPVATTQSLTAADILIPSKLEVGGIAYFENQVLSQVAADADFDNTEVLSTGITSGYGLLVVAETVGTEACVYLIAGATIEKIGTDATFTVTKDNAATYNVYWDVNQFKVQNKVGDNKAIKVGFYGLL